MAYINHGFYVRNYEFAFLQLIRLKYRTWLSCALSDKKLFVRGLELQSVEIKL